MQQKKIIIIGGGEIGSRHLQALTLLMESIDLHVVEPSHQAREKCLNRFHDMPSASRHQIHFHENLDFEPECFDIVLVASSSGARFSIIREFLKRHRTPAFLLEKFLFPRLPDYLEAEDILRKSGAKAWVNCCLRSINFYRKVRNSLPERENIKMSVSGSSWGLGSNCVHFIDLFLYLIGQSDLSEIKASFDAEIRPSKRLGYVEVNGSLEVKAGNHSLKMQSMPFGSDPINIHIDCGSHLWNIVDRLDHVEVKRSVPGGSFATKIRMPFQSEMTNLIAEEIFLSGSCSLPEYSMAARYHRQVLECWMATLQSQGIEYNESYFIT